MHRPLAIALAVALAAGLLACGEKDEPEAPGSTVATGPGSGGAEGSDSGEEPAELPDGWRREVNAEAGFTIGVPPGWQVRSTDGGQGSILASPDELIVMTVTADRTEGALQLPLNEFATRTAEAFGSEVVGRERFKKLEVTRPAPFRDTYDAVAVRAIGTSKRSGVRERLFVVVLRREGEAAYVVVSRENAEQSEPVGRDDVKAIIRSLRGRPPA